jgi:cytochrome c biogenesis protein CcmG/thiol:disulfide interchange protein DsbE
MRRPFDRLTQRGRVLVVGVGLVLALAGCTETPSVVRSTDAPAPSSGAGQAPPPGQTSAPNPDLTAAKKAAGIADCPTTGAGPAKGGLPDVRVECLGGGREVRLADLRGPTLVNVWASWCGGCREEAPFLAEASRPGSNVSLIGVDHADAAPEQAVTFAGSAGWRYPQLYDADLVFRTRLQVTGLPVTFFVRADGTVAGRHAGPFTSSEQLADLSRQYLGVAP